MIRPYERPDAVAGVVPNLPIFWSITRPHTPGSRIFFAVLALTFGVGFLRKPELFAGMWTLVCILHALRSTSLSTYSLTDGIATSDATLFRIPRIRWRDVTRAEIGPDRIVLHRASNRFPVKLGLPEEEPLRARIRAAVLHETPTTTIIEGKG